ncbi:uncharacterized protein TRIADDRAFT_51527 [Trichoplax adhaerens]|uniref:Uncharacterized protein n=1 Tax=Trichoplax adhaerens TaxID=10228 RepID=B3RJN3_TRIAD|nr:predicted protein [Trichoplax adhaerens]EDV28526.1 predicted protein [Trichoplax adhaerens]|eukprot:XP_002107728.1 predicted protein [Trichoplax adhaerens]
MKSNETSQGLSEETLQRINKLIKERVETYFEELDQKLKNGEKINADLKDIEPRDEIKEYFRTMTEGLKQKIAQPEMEYEGELVDQHVTDGEEYDETYDENMVEGDGFSND